MISNGLALRNNFFLHFHALHFKRFLALPDLTRHISAAYTVIEEIVEGFWALTTTDSDLFQAQAEINKVRSIESKFGEFTFLNFRKA